ncbi:hypothetical protein OQA88_7449 [Cercophora sp. LCS_1]
MDRLKENEELSPYAAYDFRYVQDKFPSLAQSVQGRLARMVTRRRDLLKYRKMHSERLETKPDPVQVNQDSVKEKTSWTLVDRQEELDDKPVVESTKGTTILESRLGPVVDSNGQRLTFQPVVGDSSRTSVAGSVITKEIKIKVPPRPLRADGTPMVRFKCSYYCIPVNIRTERAWSDDGKENESGSESNESQGTVFSSEHHDTADADQPRLRVPVDLDEWSHWEEDVQRIKAQRDEDEVVQCGLTEDQSSPENSLLDKSFNQARKVFAVLALIGQGSTSSELICKDNITDQDLPLSRKPGELSVLISVKSDGEAPKEFPAFKSWDERRVRDFLEKQWLVLAPVLDATSKDLTLDPNCPLPIVKSILKVKGYGFYVYQAWLHPAHQLWPTKDKPASCVAIKEVQSEDVFSRERDNLRKVEDLGHPNLIKLLASCERGSFRCFIFPWAEGGNLSDFWELEDSSPRTQDFVMWLLEQVLGLIDTIQVLHEKNIRHVDIKPQNILHFPASVEGPGSHGTLVLADIGVSEFLEQGTDLIHLATDTGEVAFVYEAPEAQYDGQTKQPRSRRYDMWSVGCVLLECTVWLLFGLGAVATFRSRRSSETKNDPKAPPGSFFQRNTKGRFQVNPMVVKALEVLRMDPRCQQGTILAALLDLVEGRLLRISPEKRAEAPEVHEELQRIVNQARIDAGYMWKGIGTPLETPNFFVRSVRRSNKAAGLGEATSFSNSSSDVALSLIVSPASEIRLDEEQGDSGPP